MTMFARRLLSGVIFVCCWGWCTWTFSQVYGQQKAPAAPKPDAKYEEQDMTLLGAQVVGQNLIIQVEYENKNWLWQVDPKAKVEITGEADQDFLSVMPNFLVARIRSEVNVRQKAATAPVSEIEIMSISDTIKPGIVEDGLGGGLGEQPKGPIPQTKNVMITGPIQGLKNGKFTIGGVKAELDPAVKIIVSLNTPGSLAVLPPKTVLKVSGDFFSMAPGRGILKAAEVKLAEPLTGPKKPMPRTPAPAKSAKSKEPADDKPKE
jgi:hypothetical protein